MVDEKILLNQDSEELLIQDRDHKYNQAYAGSDLQVNR